MTESTSLEVKDTVTCSSPNGFHLPVTCLAGVGVYRGLFYIPAGRELQGVEKARNGDKVGNVFVLVVPTVRRLLIEDPCLYPSLSPAIPFHG